MAYDMHIITCIIFACILCEFFGIKSKKKNKNHAIKDYLLHASCTWLKASIPIISLLGSENYLLWLHF